MVNSLLQRCFCEVVSRYERSSRLTSAVHFEAAAANFCIGRVLAAGGCIFDLEYCTGRYLGGDWKWFVNICGVEREIARIVRRQELEVVFQFVF